MDDDENEQQLHPNEAISAVVDEGFLAEEDDDDFDDLYNDVNVGENFLQTLKNPNNTGDDNITQGNPNLEATAAEEEDPTPPPPPLPVVESTASIPDLVSQVDVVVEEEEVQKLDNREVETGSVMPGGGMRINLGHRVDKVESELEPQQQEIVNITNTANTIDAGASLGNQGTGQQNLVSGNGGFTRQGVSVNGTGGGGGLGGMGAGGGAGGTMLFVGDLHWWTTDSEVEAELCKYGPVKEVRFFDEKASGKSKGYCQVEFFDPGSATACKEGMNGYVFNGRPCVVAHASPFSIKRMGEAQVNRTQQAANSSTVGPARTTGGRGESGGGKPMGGGRGESAPGGNFQGGGDNINRGYGRGNWGRGNGQGMGNRGPTGVMRNRPSGMMGRGMMGSGGGGFGQNIGVGPLMPPQAMMGQGFDPTFGGPMGRMGGYGGFPGGPSPPFQGMMPSFPSVGGGVGMPGVAPHVNPAFFGRGMSMGGGGGMGMNMNMMPNSNVDNTGMWSDPNMGGWGNEEHGGRVPETSYAEEAPVSDLQYGDRDRAGRPTAMKEKERGSEREWSGSSDRRYRDDRELDYEREMPTREKEMGRDHEYTDRHHYDDREVSREREYDRDRDREKSRERSRDRDRDRVRPRDDREKYVDHHHRYKDREPEYDDQWERGRSSKAHSKSRLSQEEEQRFRSRDAEYGKRRRMTSE